MFEVGSELVGKSLLVDSVEISETKKQTKYLKLVLRDKAHTISGNLWDYDEITFGYIKTGVVVKIYGCVETYKDKPQLKISKVEPSSEPMENFARSTTLDVEMMWNALVEVVGGFKEPLPKYIAEELLLKAFAEGFKRAPAARGVHNAWYGGLLEHTWTMIQLAKPIVNHYLAYYPNVNISMDKVLFGILVHDLGKIIEYDYKTPAFASTPIGILTNHLVMGPTWVYEIANRWKVTPDGQALDTEAFKMERAVLMHLVASHHGTKEWGSPVVPSTLEAIIIHKLDTLDADVMHALDFIQNKPGTVPGFTEKSYTAGTSFLR